MNDAEAHGKRYISNFNQEKIWPQTFDAKRVKLLFEKIKNLFEINFKINLMIAMNEFMK
jgi:hypothetical protein